MNMLESIRMRILSNALSQPHSLHVTYRASVKLSLVTYASAFPAIIESTKPLIVSLPSQYFD